MRQIEKNHFGIIVLPQEKEFLVRILIYNIAYGTGSPGSEPGRLVTGHRYLSAPERPFRKIGRFIGSVAPDVAGLLETDLGSRRTGGMNQPEEVASYCGMIPFGSNKYGPASKWGRLPYLRYQGNALLTRGEPESRERGYLPLGMKRLVLSVRYNGIRIMLVHLALRREVRRAQLAALAEWIDPGEPTVLAGDFNTFGGAAELTEFCARCRLQSINLLHRPTYPAWAPVRELDYMLISPHLEVTAFRVPHLFFSDHLPLVADLRHR